MTSDTDPSPDDDSEPVGCQGGSVVEEAVEEAARLGSTASAGIQSDQA
jgi:hypothetical protein